LAFAWSQGWPSGRVAVQLRLLRRLEWWRLLWLVAAAEALAELVPLLAVWVGLVPLGVVVVCAVVVVGVVVVPVVPLAGPEPAPQAQAAPVPPANVTAVAITAKVLR
jgi:hypothetical protein